VPEGEEEGAMEEMGYVGTADEVWRGPIEGY